MRITHQSLPLPDLRSLEMGAAVCPTRFLTLRRLEVTVDS